MKAIWILGAAGRVGRAVAVELAKRRVSLVLVGRDATRLQALSRTLEGESRVVIADSIAGMAAEIARGGAAVVVNTIGPFAETVLPIARACPPGCHYVDVSNELFAIRDLLALHDEAVSKRQSLVAAAGFGVLGTESVVLKVCEGRPPAERVRVDAIPVIEGSDVLGPTLAATLVNSLAQGGYRYAHGQLVRSAVGADAEKLKLPDGTTATTGAAPTGDLEAAHRASRAPFVVVGSSEAPAGVVGRVLIPVLSWLASWGPTRRFLIDRLARFRLVLPEKRREFSWTRARAQWPDGSIREGWLRAPEGMKFTASVMSEVVLRLANGEGRPGAWTPGALFGPELAEKAGGVFVLPA